MNVLYADTSAIVRAYLTDETGHAALRAMILEGSQPVVTNEIARLEFASAARSAAHAGRLKDPDPFVARFDVDCGPAGPIALLGLRRDLLSAARGLLLRHSLRTLDAIHLATALDEAARGLPGGEVVLVTRDEGQAAAARRLGLQVR